MSDEIWIGLLVTCGDDVENEIQWLVLLGGPVSPRVAMAFFPSSISLVTYKSSLSAYALLVIWKKTLETLNGLTMPAKCPMYLSYFGWKVS